jgi:hypothetical protein
VKTQAGFGAVAAVVVWTLLGVNSQQSARPVPAGDPAGPESVEKASSNAGVVDSFANGPCNELEDRLRDFILIPPGAIVAPDSCYQPGPRGGGVPPGKMTALSKHLQFVIALVPDPLHTHFSLFFDRSTEAIQQAAQDSEYSYDSSWLPWRTDQHSWTRLTDAGKDDSDKRARENQPGLLLFRSASKPDSQPDQPYDEGLLVFLVGEEATSGVHKEQFENAVEWIAKLRGRPRGLTFPMKILGPTFSGSLPSLAGLLDEDEPGDADLSVYSGTITNDAMVKWFVTVPVKPQAKPKFRSFQESDDVVISRFRFYLRKLGISDSHLAIISEDETAFGEIRAGDQDPFCGSPDGASRPACLYYPRDISAIRDAYQKQSIFNAGSSGQTPAPGHRTLSTDIADPEGNDHDTVRRYGAAQTPLSQEALLQQIISLLKAHDSQYVLLRSSNPMDQLFLSHFLRLAYPQGRIVILGADLLMRRESGAASLAGIMTLTTYPLLPWENHWTSLKGDASHSHRVFAQDLTEGTYVAARFLLDPDAGLQDRCSAHVEPGIDGHPFLPANCSCFLVRDYAPPFWSAAERTSNACCRPLRPATWLSVLGRDGFWPLAALSADQWSARDPDSPSRFSLSLRSLGRLTPFGLVSDSAALAPVEHPWPPMPASMKLCLFAALGWALFHLYCCLRPSVTSKPEHRANFVHVPGRFHVALVVFGSVVVAFAATLLGWGYGAMSVTGGPVADAGWYVAFLPSIWLIAGVAVFANAWIGSPRYPELRFSREKGEGSLVVVIGKLEGICRAGIVPLLCYCAFTLFLFWLIAFVLEAGLEPANRVPTYWRAMNLTSLVSPLIPFLALSAGLYCWFWYSLQGLGLFGADRPRLPSMTELASDAVPGNPRFLSMFSRDYAADPLESLSDPLAREFLGTVGFLAVVLPVASVFISGGIPLRTLGPKPGSIFFSLWLGICVSLMLASAWQLLRIWSRLRQLLVFLDRTPLRRTMIALKGYSWGNVWKVGGNVLNQRFKLLSRQLESLTHLANSWPDGVAPEVLTATVEPRAQFTKWYSVHWDDWRVRDLYELYRLQTAIAQLVGYLLANTLLGAWRRADASLVLGEPSQKHDAAVPAGYLGAAEELVCLTYMGFIQNILGRMRTLVMIIGGLFVAVTVSLATYPFDPRPAASRALLVLFLVLGSAVVVVYAQMCRDATLSNITDTTPGELGSEFWLKLAGFAAGPALGLLAATFPELTGSVFSWLQPGLESIK